MKPTATASTTLIGKCLRHIRGKQLTEYLKGYAAEVVITTRIMGPRAAGKSLGEEIFGIEKKISPTPILNIVAMVESQKIPMTREQLKAVVDQDEGAIRFLADNPWLIDPTGKSAPPAKKGRKTKNLTPPETEGPPEPSSPTPKNREPRPKPETPPVAQVDSVDEPAETPPNPTRITAEELRDLKRQEEENQRRPPEQKTERKPSPFRAPAPPPSNATVEEKKAYPALRKQALDDYITDQRSKGWEISADWNGYGSAAKVAKWVGPD